MSLRAQLPAATVEINMHSPPRVRRELIGSMLSPDRSSYRDEFGSPRDEPASKTAAGAPPLVVTLAGNLRRALRQVQCLRLRSRGLRGYVGFSGAMTLYAETLDEAFRVPRHKTIGNALDAEYGAPRQGGVPSVRSVLFNA